MNTIEIKDEEINVEEIMAKIRENIRRRKEAGIYTDEDLSEESSIKINNVCNNLDYLKNNADISNNSYFISSHRPVAGKFLVKGRSLINGELRRYVDPVIWKQTEFNTELVRILQDTKTGVNNIDTHLSIIDSKIDTLADKIKDELKDELSKQANEVLISMDSDIKNREWLAHLLEKRIEESSGSEYVSSSKPSDEAPAINYFIFEERFRGSRKDIKERQRAFLPYFENCKNVLDIGCGRGEFLELMREQSIGAKGVDLDKTMIEFCMSKDLDVELSDALLYLETLDDLSLDGIFMDQVVEHIDPADLIRLLELCYKKLKASSFLIAETVNPLSFTSFANFYIDMTHIRPIHPETLKYLFSISGFHEIETQFSGLVPDEARLRKLSVNEGITEGKRQQIEIYNGNIDILNATLYGAQDYAIVGKKIL